MLNFWALSVENTEEFFKRCIEREAITLPERVAIMEEMAKEGRLLDSGVMKGEAIDAVEKFFDATNHKGVLGFRKKEQQ